MPQPRKTEHETKITFKLKKIVIIDKTDHLGGVFIQCKIKLKKENHHLASGVKIYQFTNGYLV